MFEKKCCECGNECLILPGVGPGHQSDSGQCGDGSWHGEDGTAGVWTEPVQRHQPSHSRHCKTRQNVENRGFGVGYLKNLSENI